MLNLGPCSMLPPHLHARGTNYVVAVHGNTTTYMYEENGARLVTQVLTPGTATIFPQASMHMMMNTGTLASPLIVCLGSFDGTLGLHACDLEARAAGVGATGTDHTPTPSFELTKPTFIYTAANYHTGCENAQLVSALDSDDPGTLNVGQVFANGFPFELINAAFGQELASEDVKSKMTPVGTGSNWGPESCLKRCGITKPGA
jgi:hypothetical protein